MHLTEARNVVIVQTASQKVVTPTKTSSVPTVSLDFGLLLVITYVKNVNQVSIKMILPNRSAKHVRKDYTMKKKEPRLFRFVKAVPKENTLLPKE
jgi:hypothetical protein